MSMIVKAKLEKLKKVANVRLSANLYEPGWDCSVFWLDRKADKVKHCNVRGLGLDEAINKCYEAVFGEEQPKNKQPTAPGMIGRRKKWWQIWA